MYHGALPVGMEYYCVAIISEYFHTEEVVGCQHRDISLVSCVASWDIGSLACFVVLPVWPNATMTCLLELPVILRSSVSLL